MSFRRMLPFILINIFGSSAVVLSILFWWDSRQGDEQTTHGINGAAVSNPQETPTAISASSQQDNNPPPAAETAVIATEAPPLHIVQPGETLGSISTFYDVPLDDIMAANGLTNPNIISVGEQLVIPINGLEEPTPIPEPTEEAVAEIPTPIDTQPPPEGGEVIVEISQATGVGDLAAEAIQIRNIGDSSVALQNWKLADQDGFFYTFTQLTLFGDGAGIIVHTRTGQDSVTEVFWGLDTAVWDSGELVTLLDAEGQIVSTLTIP